MNRLKTLHQIILQSKESDLDKKFDRNPYEVFFDWLIDVFQYGTLLAITLIIFNFNALTLIKWIVPLGILRWLLFDIIKTYKRLK